MRCWKSHFLFPLWKIVSCHRFRGHSHPRTVEICTRKTLDVHAASSCVSGKQCQSRSCLPSTHRTTIYIFNKKSARSGSLTGSCHTPRVWGRSRVLSSVFTADSNRSNQYCNRDTYSHLEASPAECDPDLRSSGRFGAFAQGLLGSGRAADVIEGPRGKTCVLFAPESW